MDCCSAGALARGDAAILLRFPHKGYREKIWDHAAGVVIVQEAGAVITDASGGCRLPLTQCLQRVSVNRDAIAVYILSCSTLLSTSVVLLCSSSEM